MADTELGWTTIVAPNELDAHMTDNGQLDASVAILANLKREYKAKGKARAPLEPRR